MSFFRRLTNLGRGALKARKQPEPEFDAALEEELAHVVSEQEKERARARLRQMKGGEAAIIDQAEASETESEPPSRQTPPKKTL